MNKPLIKYLPPVLQAVLEMQYITTAEQTLFDSLKSAVTSVLDGQFVDTADAEGLAHFEKIFSITPRDTDTLDDRRFRIKSHMAMQTPYTYRTLEASLKALCGEDGYTLTVSASACTLDVLVALDQKSNYADVNALLGRVVPANMQINLSLMYNTHEILAGYTHAQLAAFTHQQLREEVMP